jgi:hypothetical protein
MVMGAAVVVFPQYCVTVLTGQEELEVMIWEIEVNPELVVFI